MFLYCIDYFFCLIAICCCLCFDIIITGVFFDSRQTHKSTGHQTLGTEFPAISVVLHIKPSKAFHQFTNPVIFRFHVMCVTGKPVIHTGSLNSFDHLFLCTPQFCNDISLCIFQPVYLQFIPNMMQPHFRIRHTLRHMIQTQNHISQRLILTPAITIHKLYKCVQTFRITIMRL